MLNLTGGIFNSIDNTDREAKISDLRSEGIQAWKKAAYRRYLQSRRMSKHQYVRNSIESDRVTADESLPAESPCTDANVLVLGEIVGEAGTQRNMAKTLLADHLITTIQDGLGSRYFSRSGRGSPAYTSGGVNTEESEDTSVPSSDHVAISSAEEDSSHFCSTILPQISDCITPPTTTTPLWSSDDWMFGQWGARQDWREMYVLKLRATLSAELSTPNTTMHVLPSAWKTFPIIKSIFDPDVSPSCIITSMLSVGV